MFRILLILVIQLGILFPAEAQTTLRWKFPVGSEWKSERTFTQKQIVETKVRQFTQENSSRWVVRFRVVDEASNGSSIAATLEKVEHKVKGRIGKEGIDHLLAEKMQGMEFQLRVLANGTIRDLAGYEDLVRKVAGEDLERQKALRGSLPKSGLLEAFQDLFAVLPESPVAVNSTWEREGDHPIPFFGSLRSKTVHRLAKVEKALAVVTSSTTSRYQPPKKGEELFRVLQGEVNGMPGRGDFWFDTQEGYLVRLHREQLIKGSLTIDSQGGRSEMEFQSDATVDVRRLMP